MAPRTSKAIIYQTALPVNVLNYIKNYATLSELIILGELVDAIFRNDEKAQNEILSKFIIEEEPPS